MSLCDCWNACISLDAWVWIILGSAIGALLGLVTAKKVAMTAMPETVALFNGCGGMSSLLVALAYAFDPSLLTDSTASFSNVLVGKISIVISVFVGSITFTGSIVAMAKLKGWLSTPVWMQSKIRHVINIALSALSLVAIVALLGGSGSELWLLVASSALLGIGVTLPIGGADMPVVISLLNSYSGVAAAAAGFVVESQLLIVAGAMVGAAGLILTQVMCDGMNRSLVSVLFGGALGSNSVASGGGGGEYTNITSCSPEECALTLEAAERVVSVPGYGLAVAQAQHTLREVTRVLENADIEVTYAIHPVAGRMPGHMNVLLAESNVPYDELKDLDEINSEFDRTDVAVVVGANDVTNPNARTDKSSPMYGMPILNVDKAKSVIVLKRSMASGFSGVQNELFFLDKTNMLFGDAKDSIEGMIKEVRELN